MVQRVLSPPARKCVLGIDPGSLRLGWGLISCAPNAVTHVASGLVRADNSPCLAQRLWRMIAQLEAVLAAQEIHEVAVERIFTAQNPRAALVLGQARGAVLASLGRFGLPVFEYAPTEIKQAATGHGRADKDQVALMVTRILKIPLPSSNRDTTDALAAALCHSHRAFRPVAIRA